ncbi:hypothetical protein KFE25_003092 [Diacronema lutheri]|uniref:Ankyrin repeat domain-containing protein n=1 Tax=Diacronema lutheri TaxID=2081491 RepID=A0A8J6C175_DIALT|nr:hypothetical protein KFE25_003092 [Diacronema lutheri]
MLAVIALAVQRPGAVALTPWAGRPLVRARVQLVEGLDAEGDAVGPGIFGGNVQRASDGTIVIGRQYEDHNSLPGPVYAGGGYTPLNAAIRAADLDTVARILADDPSLADEVSTGGARPLHVCGMSPRAQEAAQLLVDAGADVEATDTWGYTPLQRAATNNLARSAAVLLRAGADPARPSGLERRGDSARKLARRLRSFAVLKAIQDWEEARGIPLPDDEMRL